MLECDGENLARGPKEVNGMQERVATAAGQARSRTESPLRMAVGGVFECPAHGHPDHLSLSRMDSRDAGPEKVERRAIEWRTPLAA